MALRITNRRRARSIRRSAVLVSALWSLATLDVLLGGDDGSAWWEYPVAVLYLTAYLLFAYVGCRRLGLLHQQPYLELDDIGLRYGDAQVVPWSDVRALRRHRRQLVYDVAPDWPARGVLARMTRRRALPVTVFDWTVPHDDVVRFTAQAAPSVEIGPVSLSPRGGRRG